MPGGELLCSEWNAKGQVFPQKDARTVTPSPAPTRNTNCPTEPYRGGTSNLRSTQSKMLGEMQR